MAAFRRTAGPGFSRRRFHAVLAFTVTVVMIVITVWWAEYQLSGPLLEWARLRAANAATEAIHDAISEAVGSRAERVDLVQFVTEGQQPPLFQYNTGALNQLIADAVKAILHRFDDYRAEELSVPFGEVSGLTLLAGRGPLIPVRIMTTGAVRAEPKVDFQASGINQVSHRIYLDVEVEMLVVAPFVRETIVVPQPILLTEVILPGDVPETYVNLVGYTGTLAEWLAMMGTVVGH